MAIIGCAFAGANIGIGVNMVGRPGVGQQYALVFNYDDCNFMGLETGIYYNQYTQGVSVSNTNFGGVDGIYVPSGIQGPDQLLVNNCQFGPLLGNAIWAQSPLPNMMISCCEFYIPDSSSSWAILMEHDYLPAITNNIFHSLGLPAALPTVLVLV